VRPIFGVLWLITWRGQGDLRLETPSRCVQTTNQGAFMPNASFIESQSDDPTEQAVARKVHRTPVFLNLQSPFSQTARNQTSTTPATQPGAAMTQRTHTTFYNTGGYSLTLSTQPVTAVKGAIHLQIASRWDSAHDPDGQQRLLSLTLSRSEFARLIEGLQEAARQEAATCL
jgi:hypothetical protein